MTDEAHFPQHFEAGSWRLTDSEIEALALRIATSRVRGAEVAQSMRFLQRARERSVLDTVDKLVDAPDERDARAIWYHLDVVCMALRAALAARLTSVDDYEFREVVFKAALLFPPDEVEPVDIIATLLSGRLGSAAVLENLIVVPLQDFGFDSHFADTRAAFEPYVDHARRFALIPQTNGLESTVARLGAVTDQLGLRVELLESLLRHTRSSRGASWLERNPLLVAVVNGESSSGVWGDGMIQLRVNSITSWLTMVAALDWDPGGMRAHQRHSTKDINSFPTRDVSHYIFSPLNERRHHEARVSFFGHGLTVDDLTLVGVSVDRVSLECQPGLISRAYKASENLVSAYAKHVLGGSGPGALRETSWRAFEAVTHFRRSYRSDWASAISLATAFEVLLTDGYERGVRARLEDRVRRVISPLDAVHIDSYVAAVGDLYGVRSRLVHDGTPSEHDLANAQRAFVLCCIAIIEKLPQLPPDMVRPIEWLTESCT